MKSFFQSTLYGDLTKVVQVAFNEATKRHVELFGKTYIDEWFEFKNPQYNLTISQLMGKYNIRVMAPLIADKSLTPVRSRHGAEMFVEKIPRFGHKTLITVDEIRELRQMMETQSPSSDATIRAIFEENKRNELINTMMGTVQDTVLGAKDSLAFLVISALFNGGIVKFDEFNNPEGIPYTIDYGMPKENIIKVKPGEVWSDENLANGTVNPVKVIMDILHKFRNKVNYDSILCSPGMIYKIASAKSVLLAIKGNNDANTLIPEDELNGYLSKFKIPPLKEITKEVGILKDGIQQNIDPVNDDVLVFKPAGQLGVVRPAFEDNEIIEEDNVSYSNMSNGIRVAQWKVGESTGQNAGEYTQASIRALPVITAINGVVNLKVNNVTSK